MLTNEQITLARELIERYRKFAGQWRIVRWLVLLAGVLMLVIMVLVWQQLQVLESFDAEVLPTEPSGKELKAMLNERMDMLRLELRLYLAVFLHAVLGPILVAASLYGWSRWPLHLTLKARLLESVLENELAANRTFEFMKEEDA